MQRGLNIRHGWSLRLLLSQPRQQFQPLLNQTLAQRLWRDCLPALRPLVEELEVAAVIENQKLGNL